MKLTNSRLHKIIKKYNNKLDSHEKDWSDLCLKAYKKSNNNNIFTPSIFEHEKHNSKGYKLFKDLLNELNKYEIF